MEGEETLNAAKRKAFAEMLKEIVLPKSQLSEIKKLISETVKSARDRRAIKELLLRQRLDITTHLVERIPSYIKVLQLYTNKDAELQAVHEELLGKNAFLEEMREVLLEARECLQEEL